MPGTHHITQVSARLPGSSQTVHPFVTTASAADTLIVPSSQPTGWRGSWRMTARATTRMTSEAAAVYPKETTRYHGSCSGLPSCEADLQHASNDDRGDDGEGADIDTRPHDRPRWRPIDGHRGHTATPSTGTEPHT